MRLVNELKKNAASRSQAEERTAEGDRMASRSRLRPDGLAEPVCHQRTGPSKPRTGTANRPNRVIRIKERSLKMLINDLILRNPLRLMQADSTEDALRPGSFGAVLARAGVGKTALLVQLALNSMLEKKNVLHISLQDPVNKVSLWYTEVFGHIAQQYAVSQANELWDTLLPHRFIMTFQVEGFTVPKLEERVNDLSEQDIFTPHMIIIDGYPFEQGIGAALSELKEMAGKRGCHVWFTVRTHRHQAPEKSGLPRQLSDIAKLFDIILQLQPEGKDIHIKALKGPATGAGSSELFLDPATMLITNNR